MRHVHHQFQEFGILLTQRFLRFFKIFGGKDQLVFFLGILGETKTF